MFAKHSGNGLCYHWHGPETESLWKRAGRDVKRGSVQGGGGMNDGTHVERSLLWIEFHVSGACKETEEMLDAPPTAVNHQQHIKSS